MTIGQLIALSLGSICIGVVAVFSTFSLITRTVNERSDAAFFTNFVAVSFFALALIFFYLALVS